MAIYNRGFSNQDPHPSPRLRLAPDRAPPAIRNNVNESGKTTIDRAAGCHLCICTRNRNCLLET